MGRLILPVQGAVYIDANVLIYRVEQVEPYLRRTQLLWDALDAGRQEVVTSELTAHEVLVRPLREANTALCNLFLGILYATPSLTCAPITRAILEQAAALRASIQLKAPDAIHAATARSYGCGLLLTNDPAFRRVPGLDVMLLSELDD